MSRALAIRSGERGHAMLELAISASLMVTCLMGTFEFGYTFYVYNQLVTAVGNGGRYAAMRTYHGASDQDVEMSNRAIRNMVVYGDPEPTADAVPAVVKLKPEQVEVRWIMADKSDAKGAPAAVNVSIRDYTVDAVFKTFTFSGRPTVEFPFVGPMAAQQKPAEPKP
jgi:Flp pilus assembly protein TadG